MNKQQQSALAVAVAAALGGLSGEAQAARYTANLASVNTYGGNGSSAGNISSSTATWEYDDATSQLTQTGGTYNARFTITPTTTLYRHSIIGLVIGNGGAATATDFSCTEGNFGSGVGASICGNYNFGANFANESTATWGPGISNVRTMGGDDNVIGPEQSIFAYDNFATTSFTGTSLTLSNAVCNPSAPGNANGCSTTGGFNSGQTWTLDNLTQLAIPVDDTVQVQMDTPTQIAVLANDGPVADPATVTVTGAPTQGATAVNGSPGAPAGISVTYTPNAGVLGADSFVYEVQAANLPGGVGTATVNITIVDTIPDAFSFTPVTGAAQNSVQTSEPAQINGISAPAAISVSGGQYAINCGATYTAAPGTISNGETVCVRQTASASPLTQTDATLSVGGVDAVFSVTTGEQTADITPDPFTFEDLPLVPENELITSNPVTITGINAPAPISVVGGTYSIGCTGPYTAEPGEITDGQTVCVQHTSASTSRTETTTTLTVGDPAVSDDFSSATGGGGGSSAVDGLMAGFLGLLGLARLRRK